MDQLLVEINLRVRSFYNLFVDILSYHYPSFVSYVFWFYFISEIDRH